MDSLVGYGSDDEVESDRYGHQPSVSNAGRRKEDDVNYDDVNMDMSEESQGVESEPEQPPAAPPGRKHSRDERRGSNDRGAREPRREREQRRETRRDERPVRGRHDSSRRGYERPEHKMPALMDLKPYGGEPPHDARDAVSPRFVDRERRDRERDRDRERERDREGRHSRRSEEKRSGRDRLQERSRSRGVAFPPPHSVSNERRVSPTSGDYRPSSYKVNKKLEVMEKMGLQIKTPDGSMATAQQLRAAAGDGLPAYYNPGAVNSSKILDQVQKRKLLWSNKEKRDAEAEAAKWSGARFSQDNDGKQVSKFMRLMGIKDPTAVVTETVDSTVDPNKKQEELFQAMQAQYEVARATTHTMRGVGLGFQRGNL